MDRKTRVMMEKNAFIFIGFLAALKMIKWTAPVFDKFLDLSLLGVDVATILGGVFAYLLIRYLSKEI